LPSRKFGIVGSVVGNNLPNCEKSQVLGTVGSEVGTDDVLAAVKSGNTDPISVRQDVMPSTPGTVVTRGMADTEGKAVPTFTRLE